MRDVRLTSVMVLIKTFKLNFINSTHCTVESVTHTRNFRLRSSYTSLGKGPSVCTTVYAAM